ncbi:hypothetical protein SAMN05518846_114118 [Brevibacillus centrosporus]|uniref:Uncharacterized protein n=1 Tax=Brevibacillus centrosporus TaxID=54910 RepID=A0A1I4A298_9BACL|nr:hypothetical protein EDM55_23205 [Brevibacillus centrosporus]SFK50484.1 hypothetical protein SAMN05518846_114118 [Brevibacillus centrosporus]
MSYSLRAPDTQPEYDQIKEVTCRKIDSMKGLHSLSPPLVLDPAFVENNFHLIIAASFFPTTLSAAVGGVVHENKKQPSWIGTDPLS